MKIFKKIICSFFAALLLITNCLAFSDSSLNLSFTTPNSYTELNAKNAKKQSELLELLGHNKESFTKYLNDNNICYFALTNNNKEQIIIKTFETDFSKELIDLTACEEDEKLLISAMVPKNAAGYSFVTLAGTKYFQIIFKSNDSGGDYSCVQYLTIRNKRFYSICFNFSEKTLSDGNLDKSFEMAKEIKITNTLAAAVWSAQDIFIFFIVVLLLIALIVVIFLILISFIKDIKTKRRQIETGEDIKVERRRFK